MFFWKTSPEHMFKALLSHLWSIRQLQLGGRRGPARQNIYLPVQFPSALRTLPKHVTQKPSLFSLPLKRISLLINVTRQLAILQVEGPLEVLDHMMLIPISWKGGKEGREAKKL